MTTGTHDNTTLARNPTTNQDTALVTDWISSWQPLSPPPFYSLAPPTGRKGTHTCWLPHAVLSGLLLCLNIGMGSHHIITFITFWTSIRISSLIIPIRRNYFRYPNRTIMISNYFTDFYGYSCFHSKLSTCLHSFKNRQGLGIMHLNESQKSRSYKSYHINELVGEVGWLFVLNHVFLWQFGMLSSGQEVLTFLLWGFSWGLRKWLLQVSADGVDHHLLKSRLLLQ